MYLPNLLANSSSVMGDHRLLLNRIEPWSNQSTPIEKSCGVHLNSIYKTTYLHLPKQEKIKRCKTKIGNIKCHYNLVSWFFFLIDLIQILFIMIYWFPATVKSLLIFLPLSITKKNEQLHIYKETRVIDLALIKSVHSNNEFLLNKSRSKENK